ncbi:MAG: alpha/beta hydrolase [Deltaproteobacteria bacterium]|nr:MAG: alpha/beta hydrolase [Deltaproteobacteria bacterium]
MTIDSGFAQTDDGIGLYWRSVGEGPPLVCCNGVGVSTFFFKYVVRHFREHFQVVVWDYRGHGLSGTPKDVRAADLSVENNARDLALVMDAAGIDQPAVLLGHSMGCQVILEFAKQFPERAAALVPMFGTFARPLDTFMDSPYSRRAFGVLNAMAKMGGRNTGRMLRPIYASPLSFAVGRGTGLVDKYYCQRRDLENYLDHMVHLDPQVFMRMCELMADHDLTDFLPQCETPTLVIAGENDLFTPLHRSEKMAELLPNSELFILAEGSHAAIVEYPETINRRIERFLVAHDVYTQAITPSDATAADASAAERP